MKTFTQGAKNFCRVNYLFEKIGIIVYALCESIGFNVVSLILIWSANNLHGQLTILLAYPWYVDLIHTTPVLGDISILLDLVKDFGDIQLEEVAEESKVDKEKKSKTLEKKRTLELFQSFY